MASNWPDTMNTWKKSCRTNPSITPITSCSAISSNEARLSDSTTGMGGNVGTSTRAMASDR